MRGLGEDSSCCWRSSKCDRMRSEIAISVGGELLFM
jgi:hypothetical protein